MSHYTAPHFDRCALITIDVQRDTLDGQPFEVPGTSAALPNLRRLATMYRQARLPIVHMVRVYLPDGSNVDRCRREMIEGGTTLFAPDTVGCELAEELLPGNNVQLNTRMLLDGQFQKIGPAELIAYKPRWGAFFGTGLHSYLDHCGVDTLVFAGCNYPNCPRTSIYQASERDYRVVVAGDALSGLTDVACSELAGIGVSVVSTDAIGRRMAE